MPTVEFRLYLVTDRLQTRGRPLLPLLRAAGDAGLPAVQIRERDLSTRPLLELVSDVRRGPWLRQPMIFVNDRVDVALAAGADGVHLRASSLPVSAARRVLGPHKMLAVSTHSAEEVRRAEDEGADFVVFGPVYDTPSKRSYGPPQGLAALERAAGVSRIPVFAIGGVTRERVSELLDAGAFGVAVVSALLAADDIAHETGCLLRELHRVV